MPQKKNNSNNSKKTQNAYFLSLELENVRCFGERQKIDFSDGNGKWKRWTIILGNNGTGKTTILHSLIFHFLAYKSKCLLESAQSETDTNIVEANKLLEIIEKESKKPKNFRDKLNIIQKNTKIALGKINVAEDIIKKVIPKIADTHFGGQDLKGNIILFSNPVINNCFAYGASRKVGEASISEQNDESVYQTLFNEAALLINPEEWLLQADYAAKRRSKFQQKRERELNLIKEILVKILPDVDDIRFGELERGRTPKPTVEFHTPYGWVESKDLSLGYRTSMAWMVDFASRMFDLYPESENPLAEPAVVLIDEIDLHLHPKWQRELLDYLSNLFPNTQFIVTTHSPLIVQSAAARDANIVVCRREGDHVVIDQSVEAVKNWRADQILTSDLFGLETSRPKEIEKDLLERQAILSKAKLTKKDEKRLTELEKKIGSVPVMENPKYDEAMDIIFRAAEKLEKKNGNPK